MPSRKLKVSLPHLRKGIVVVYDEKTHIQVALTGVVHIDSDGYLKEQGSVNPLERLSTGTPRHTNHRKYERTGKQ